MPTQQTQIRRDSNTNLIATVPAQGEPGYDITNHRLVVGDGARAGGYPHANFIDVQGQVFTAAAAGGTANAITITLASHFAPTAYAVRQRFQFIAALTNTGAATLNVNGRGAKTLKKIQAGALLDVAAGDIASGRPYDVMYDGTYFVLMGFGGGVADGSITNSKLATAIAGNYIAQVALAICSGMSAAYSKQAEFRIQRAGTYTTRMRLSNPASTGIVGRVYVNGAAVGTERSYGSQPAVWYNQNIAMSEGDLCQLYLRFTLGSTVNEDYHLRPALALMEGAPLVGGRLYTHEFGWS